MELSKMYCFIILNYCTTSRWTLIWAFNRFPLSNCIPQMSHGYGLSSVWFLMWTDKLLERLKAFPQNWQANGFSPVWSLIWQFNADLWVNLVPQVSQANGFSPVWTLWCITNWDLYLKTEPHVPHLNPFWAVWASLWLFQGLFFASGSAALVDPESPCLPPSWFWLSATWELWERSRWSLFGSGPLWSLSS